MEFSRQEYWSGLPFPSPGDLLDPGIEPRSPSLWADSLPTEQPGNTKKKKKKKKKPPIKKTTKNRGELLNHKRPDSLIQWIVGGTCKFAFVPGSQVILMLLDLWTREQLN